MDIANKIKNRIISGLKCIKTSLCYRSFFHNQIQSDLIFIESRNGRDFAGNMLRILLEIRKLYGLKYKIVTAARKEKYHEVKRLLHFYGLDDIKIYEYESVSYYNTLEKAKYLINDSTFPDRFIKREEQIYINTWHGTPFKHMGKDSAANAHLMYNVQRNLFMSDYLVFPSDYCREKFVNAYCLDELYEGTVLMEGYPRNAVFFNELKRAEVRRSFLLDDRKIYVYMPTFREKQAKHQDSEQKEALKGYFDRLDSCLYDDEVFFVKLHYYVAQDMDFSRYSHIKVFPSDIETYEFLNTADILISDYSSVMYDFANTGKKIIRFIYDQEDYDENRGFYEQPVDFPFPAVKTVDELISELHSGRLESYDTFKNVYCTYDNIDASEAIVRRVFENIKTSKELSIKTDREKVIIYGGALEKNGITTGMINLLNNMDDDKKYYVSYSRKTIDKKIQNVKNIRTIDNVFEFSGFPQYTILEAMALFIYYKFNKYNGMIGRYIDRLYKRENKRCFGSVDFSTYVQFVGYEKIVITMFEKAKSHNVIFVHNDMGEEMKRKKNQHYLTLRNAYRNYDKVAVVSDFLIPKIAQISGRSDNIVVCENIQNYSEIQQKAKLPISIQAETEVVLAGLEENGKELITENNREPDKSAACGQINRIEKFLDSYKHKFITVGRFSVEKQHERLIKAFEMFYKTESDSCLVIIGGYGNMYEQTKERVLKSEAKNNIMIIKSIDNPFPVLERCSCFVLSSDYEGAPMVLHEASICKLPVITTRAGGTASFVEKNGGLLVESTPEAIFEGMNRFICGKIQVLDTDYASYNKNCIKQFRDVI